MRGEIGKGLCVCFFLRECGVLAACYLRKGEVFYEFTQGAVVNPAALENDDGIE